MGGRGYGGRGLLKGHQARGDPGGWCWKEEGGWIGDGSWVGGIGNGMGMDKLDGRLYARSQSASWFIC